MHTLTEIAVAPSGFVAIYKDFTGGHTAHIVMAYGIIRNLSTKDDENVSVVLGPSDFTNEADHEYTSREMVASCAPDYVVCSPDLYTLVARHSHSARGALVPVKHDGTMWTVVR